MRSQRPPARAWGARRSPPHTTLRVCQTSCCLTRADTSEPAAFAGHRYLLELTASSCPAGSDGQGRRQPLGGAAFDCSWRKLAYSYVPRLHAVTKTKAKELFDALELEALCGETFDATTPPALLNATRARDSGRDDLRLERGERRERGHVDQGDRPRLSTGRPSSRASCLAGRRRSAATCRSSCEPAPDLYAGDASRPPVRPSPRALALSCCFALPQPLRVPPLPLPLPRRACTDTRVRMFHVLLQVHVTTLTPAPRQPSSPLAGSLPTASAAPEPPVPATSTPTRSWISSGKATSPPKRTGSHRSTR